MPCHLVVYDRQAKTTTQRVCDEDNTTRVVEEDHAGTATGAYTDVNDQRFSIDWTKCQLVGFHRKDDKG